MASPTPYLTVFIYRLEKMETLVAKKICLNFVWEVFVFCWMVWYCKRNLLQISNFRKSVCVFLLTCGILRNRRGDYICVEHLWSVWYHNGWLWFPQSNIEILFHPQLLVIYFLITHNQSSYLYVCICSWISVCLYKVNSGLLTCASVRLLPKKICGFPLNSIPYADCR